MTHLTAISGSARHGRGRFNPISLLMALNDIATERYRLAQLDTDRLSDLGLTRKEARAEARRPFWALPAGRA